MSDPVHAVHVEADFPLEAGLQLPRAEAACVTLGRLNAARDNAVLVAHGYTSSHRFVLEGSAGASEGSWAPLVGPGRAIDTDRWFVVATNALGSCHGSTGPASVDPTTGRPYGSSFPPLTFADIVRLQRRLLQGMGIERLHAVVGVSMGGYQALQWGVQYPDAVGRIGVVLSHLSGGDPSRVQALQARLAADPAWNGGQGAAGAMRGTLVDLRLDTLRRYGMARWLEDQPLTQPEREARLLHMAQAWAESFDPHSLVVLLQAITRFDVRPELNRLRAQVLLVLCPSDVLFPAARAKEVIAALEAVDASVKYHELDSPYGHLASGLDWERWAPVLREFIG